MSISATQKKGWYDFTYGKTIKAEGGSVNRGGLSGNTCWRIEADDDGLHRLGAPVNDTSAEDLSVFVLPYPLMSTLALPRDWHPAL